MNEICIGCDNEMQQLVGGGWICLNCGEQKQGKVRIDLSKVDLNESAKLAFIAVIGVMIDTNAEKTKIEQEIAHNNNIYKCNLTVKRVNNE